VAWRFEDGRALTYGQLRALAARWPRAGSTTHKELILLAADGSAESLRDLVCALVAGHAVMLVPHDARALIERIEQTFSPSLVARREGQQWKLRRRHSRQLALHPELALLLSTSGTTGENKFVRLSYDNLLSNAQSIAGYLSLDSSSCALLNLPLHYSYGLSIVTSHLACGGTTVVTDRSVTDPQLWPLFESAGCTSLAGVPHTYELLATSGFFDRALPRLRQLTQAGGRLREPLLQRFAQWARERGVDFLVMYGQTEASPRMAYLPAADAIRAAGCIGQAIPGGQLRLEDESGQPIGEAGVAGELVYEGPNVMMGYATSAPDLALPPGPRILRTGDLALVDPSTGYFRITGRASRFLKIFGLRLSLDEVERQLEAAGLQGACTGDDDTLAVATRLPRPQHEALVQAVRQATGLPRDRIVVLGLDEWPTLPSGKTDYRALQQLFQQSARTGVASPAAQASKSPSLDDCAAGPARPATPEPASRAVAADAVKRIFEETLGKPVPWADASFQSLGGDSLTYVRAAIALQRIIPQLPADWPSRSVAQLQRLCKQEVPRQRWWSMERIEMSLLIRAIAPVLVVVYHADHPHWAGGALLLLALVGFNVQRFLSNHLAEGRWRLVATNLVSRVLVPFWLLAGLYAAAHYHNPWPELLLVGNLIDSDAHHAVGFETWFVHVTAQSMLFLMLLSGSKRFRQHLAQQPFAVCLALLGFGLVLHHGAHAVWPQLAINQGRDWPYAFWFFALGMLIQASQRFTQRLLTTVLAMGLIVYHLDHDLARMTMLAVGSLLLLWVHGTRVPKLLVPLVGTLASASLFIYILHVRAPVDTVTASWDYDVLRIGLGVVIGIAGWWIYEKAWALLRMLWRGAAREAGPENAL
jgi:acyl-coenzyme A synthetase/AMP-(fatty) acid ligase